MVFNNHSLRVIGVVNKQMKFTPAGFSLDLHANEEASEWALNVTNSEVEHLLSVSIVTWRSMSDYSSTTFNSLIAAWTGTRQGDWHFRMLKQVKSACAKCLCKKSNLNLIIADLKKIQLHPFPTMTDKSCELLKIKCDEK